MDVLKDDTSSNIIVQFNKALITNYEIKASTNEIKETSRILYLFLNELN